MTVTTATGVYTVTEEDLLVALTTSLLMDRDIPVDTIDAATVRYWLRHHMTPTDIVRDVWKLGEPMTGKES